MPERAPPGHGHCVTRRRRRSACAYDMRYSPSTGRAIVVHHDVQPILMHVIRDGRTQFINRLPNYEYRIVCLSLCMMLDFHIGRRSRNGFSFFGVSASTSMRMR